MKAFMDRDFLLSNDTAKHLYHDIAAKLPIIDYHCHIPPKEIVEDRRFENITQVWLGGDHYKWRVMRAMGVPEEEITGNAPDRVKFQRWAETMPMLMGNPLYHWTHLELQRFFGIAKTLNTDTAEEIWKDCNEKLKTLTVRQIIRESGVEALCTTDDPADDLAAQIALAKEGYETRVLPGWRPDKALNPEKPGFAEYIQKLAKVAGKAITGFDELLAALDDRMEFFRKNGCRVCDHGMESILFSEGTYEEVDEAFRLALAGKSLTEKQLAQYKTALMVHLGQKYAQYGWTMQIHYGALRNNNSVCANRLGPDKGYDSIGDGGCGRELALLLDAIRRTGKLPATVVFSLNPNDCEMISSILGCFWEGGMAGCPQVGAAWWFNDTRDGMVQQLHALANTAVLGRALGMLTDSRSFLSYPRHEYFRRILCNEVGIWVENGEYPMDEATLNRIISAVCYGNARDMLGEKK